ncbi:uncharacterized protein LOC116620706 [Nematostella vectensis]|uniref:uncharacterized protein LOC116620706 n=1 Tax=Nematostella vectensis TaxID=45351 RepID=UPI00138FFC20|nr:uncharacterized protein LOC116620706 [Nematostella vectensis]
MPYQQDRYLPPIATPIVSRYQTTYVKQDTRPPASFKSRNATNLPPINYSQCRRKVGDSLYSETYKGTFGPSASTAKPAPYVFPSKGRFETSEYRANYMRRSTLQLPLLPRSATRRNNPHPTTMRNAFTFPQRGYWIWPHLLNPMFVNENDPNSDGQPARPELERRRGPYDIWENEYD